MAFHTHFLLDHYAFGNCIKIIKWGEIMRAKIMGLLTAIVIVTSACMSTGEDEVSAEQVNEIKEIQVQTIVTPTPTPFPDFDLEHLAICGRGDEDANEKTDPEGEHQELEEETQSPEEEIQSPEEDCDTDLYSGMDEGNQDISQTDGGTEQEDQEDPDQEPVYLGEYMITFYCPCEICCGEWATGCTASGVLATPNHTIACDLPFGTVVEIEGLGTYVVEDRGVSGAQIDVFVTDHQEALNLGVQYRDVYILED